MDATMMTKVSNATLPGLFKALCSQRVYQSRNAGHTLFWKLCIHFSKTKISLRKVVELLATIGYEPYISLDEANKKKTKRYFFSLRLDCVTGS